jgi:hypothetical protein
MSLVTKGCHCATCEMVTRHLNGTTDKQHLQGGKTLTTKLVSKHLQPELASEVLHAIDETLEMVCRRTRSEVYFRIQKEVMMERNEIPARLEDFSRGLDEILGSTSLLIESDIVRNLYSRSGRKFDLREDSRLTDYVLNLAGDSERTHLIRNRLTQCRCSSGVS